MQSQADKNKMNILRTLYFHQELRWCDLENWTTPRLTAFQIGEAIGDLLQDGKIVVEKRKGWNGRYVQFVLLADSVLEAEIFSEIL